jgi:hypothetical protein
MVNAAAMTVSEASKVESRQADVGGISEITILPDGRLYVLGLSESMWELLDAAGPWGGLSPERQPRRSAERDAKDRPRNKCRTNCSRHAPP